MKKLLLASLVATSFSIPAMAAELDITVANLTHGNTFTPLLVTAHANTLHVFQTGTTASANLRTMAEGGDIAGLVTDLDAASADSIANPAAGLLAPGASTSFMLNTSEGNNYLSAVAMVLPTNDAFLGLNAWKIPSEPGTYTINLSAYDAGTEVNDEIINGGGTTGVPGIPADPSGQAGSGAMGVTTEESNTNIHIHRGVLGDTNATGGRSDLDSRIHRWLNPVARIVVTVK